MLPRKPARVTDAPTHDLHSEAHEALRCSNCRRSSDLGAAADIIGGLASWMWQLGHIGVFLVAEAVAMLGATLVMQCLLRDMPWVAQPE